LFSAAAIVTIGILVIARPRATVVRWALWSVPAGLTGTIVLAASFAQRRQIGGLTEPDLTTVISTLAETAGLAVVSNTAILAMILAALAALAIVSAIALRHGRPATLAADESRRLLFAFTLAFVTPAALALFSWVATPVFLGRYLVWVALGSALLAGAGARVVREGTRPYSLLAAALVAVLAASSIAAATPNAFLPSRPHDDMPAAVAGVQASVSPGDVVVLLERFAQTGIQYGFARTAGDDNWANNLRERFAAGEDTDSATRFVVSSDPLTLAAQAPPIELSPDRTVWLLGLSGPSPADIDQIADATGCRVSSDVGEPQSMFGDLRLYALKCDQSDRRFVS